MSENLPENKPKQPKTLLNKIRNKVSREVSIILFAVASLVGACGKAIEDITPTEIPLNVSQENTIGDIPEVSDFEGTVGDVFTVDLSGVTTASGAPATFAVVENKAIEATVDQNTGMVTLKALAAGTNAVEIKVNAPKVTKEKDTNGDGVKDNIIYENTEKSLNLNIKAAPRVTSEENTISNIPEISPQFNKKVGEIFTVDLSGVTTASGKPATFAVTENNKIEATIDQNTGIITLKALEVGTIPVEITITAGSYEETVDSNEDGVADTTTTYTNANKTINLEITSALDTRSQENTILNIPEMSQFNKKVGEIFTIDLSRVTTASGKPATFAVVENNKIEHSIDENKILTLKALEVGTIPVEITINSPDDEKTVDNTKTTYKGITKSLKLNIESTLKQETPQGNVISNIPEMSQFNKKVEEIFTVDLSGVTTASGQPATFAVTENNKIEHSISQDKILTLKALEAGTHAVTITITADRYEKTVDTNNDGVKDTATTYTKTEKSIDVNIIANKTPNSFEIPSTFPAELSIPSFWRRSFDLPVIKDSNNNIILPTISIEDTSVVETATLNDVKQLLLESAKTTGSTKVTLLYTSPETSTESPVPIAKEILVHVKALNTINFGTNNGVSESNEYIGTGQKNFKRISSGLRDQEGNLPEITATSSNPNIIPKVVKIGINGEPDNGVKLSIKEGATVTDGEEATITVTVKTAETQTLASHEKEYTFKAIVETTPVDRVEVINKLVIPAGTPDTFSLSTFVGNAVGFRDLDGVNDFYGARPLFEIKRRLGGDPGVILTAFGGVRSFVYTQGTSGGAVYELTLKTAPAEIDIYEEDANGFNTTKIIKRESRKEERKTWIIYLGTAGP